MISPSFLPYLEKKTSISVSQIKKETLAFQQWAREVAKLVSNWISNCILPFLLKQ
jgi:hypothetical protein